MPVDKDALSETVLFEDGKDADALRTIGEVAEALGIKRHVLRYWEQQFPSLKPLKRSGGRRYYRPEDIAVIQQINILVNEKGFTLKGARKALRDGVDVENIMTGTETGDQRRVFAFSGSANGDAGTGAAQPTRFAGGEKANGSDSHRAGSGETEPKPGGETSTAKREVISQLESIRSTLTQALEK